MSAEVSIRRAVAADAAALAQIAAEVIEDVWPERSIAEEIARPHAEVLVASEERGGADFSQEDAKTGRPDLGCRTSPTFADEERRRPLTFPPSRLPVVFLGFAITWRVADESSLLLIAVSRDFHRRGIGRALLAEAESSAKRAGARAMHLEVRRSNDRAQAFYRAQGYAETGVRRGYYASDGADAVLMEKRFKEEPSHRLDVTLAVLAGGRGTRLGGLIKPLLRDREGRTLLAAIEETLGPQVARSLVVAPNALVPYLSPHTASPILEDRGLGPGAALIDTAHGAETEWLLLVGGDQPCPSVMLLFRLFAQATADFDAVVVELEAKRQTLWALYRRRAIVKAFPREAIARPLALQAVLDRVRVRVIDGSILTAKEEAAYIDVDTPDRMELLGLSSEGVPRIG